ncbi:uncharacterized protein F4822DRAFT_386905 [Hypoxylon trugodes]|uniref:uncharacterized protein n=1 Tax=Hypoxylon trugodes TaxID=326681 RepID=UPI002193F702|nr:uncharacterized protein F4822DRAFT_386905 [Hypoxylon trugodes]KAI1394051.1 hypothetical protein F4822DRAFT_386905 [Hypoxylon trugodes]
MGPFALSVPAHRLGIHSQTGRRKKADDNQEDDDNIDTDFEWDVSSSRLPSESINPLSYSPDTLQQFAVAGLSPEDEVPSSIHPLFPHKATPAEGKKRRARRSDRVFDVSEAESENDEAAPRRKDEGATVKQVSERLKHLSTLTAIMHRCLSDGDIARAKRAFGLLVQTGDVDIKQGGLWAIGSEILMRDGEAQLKQGKVGGGEARDQPDGENTEIRRWGSAANVDKVRSYFESLIQQYPHDPHRPHLTSALDFWPALFGIEIYNLDAELQKALHRLPTTPADEQEDGDEYGYGYGEDEEMAYSDEAIEARRRQRDDERQGTVQAARDEVKLQARDVAERVAAQMDQIMENNPFATHRELLRLRGNLALFIGDLCLSSRLIDYERNEEEISLKSSEDALRSRAESVEDHGALAMRREEHEKARTLFRKIMDGGGEVDDWILKFVRAGEEDEQHDVTLEDGW